MGHFNILIFRNVLWISPPLFGIKSYNLGGVKEARFVETSTINDNNCPNSGKDVQKTFFRVSVFAWIAGLQQFQALGCSQTPIKTHGSLKLSTGKIDI